MSGKTRVRLGSVEVQPLRGRRCRIRVVLEVPDAEPIGGEADGRDSDAGRLRGAAEAAARALESVAGGRISLEVLGVKALHTFDCILVVVSLASRAGGEAERLVGSCIAADEDPRGAALAVLNATNRLLSRTLEGGP